MMRFVYLLLLSCWSVSIAWSQSQRPTVKATLSPDTILIGDRFTVRVEVEKDIAQVVDFPRFDKDKQIVDTFEIVSVSKIDTVKGEDRRQMLAIEYLMTCFDAGNYNIGRFPVLYMDKNIVDTLFSQESLGVVVRTFEIDTLTQKIVDIKPPIHTPLQFSEIKNWVYLGLVVLVLLVAIIWLIRFFVKKKNAIDPSRPQEPPHVTAIRRMEELRELKLWQNGKYKLYYTALTDIIRDYIEGRYGISAGEMTSDEILIRLKTLSLKEIDYRRMQQLFSTADLVKFAKFTPVIETNDECYSAAYYFVEDTKLLPSQQELVDKGEKQQERR